MILRTHTLCCDLFGTVVVQKNKDNNKKNSVIVIQSQCNHFVEQGKIFDVWVIIQDICNIKTLPFRTRRKSFGNNWWSVEGRSVNHFKTKHLHFVWSRCSVSFLLEKYAKCWAAILEPQYILKILIIFGA